MKKSFLFLFALLLFAACSKNDPVGPDNTYKNGNTSPENSYHPTSKGTWWKYEGIIEGEEISFTTTAGDEVEIDGQYYAKVMVVTPTEQSESYMRMENNDIYTLSLIGTSTLKKENEMCMLKTASPIGTTWTSKNYTNGNVTFKYDYQIVNRDFSFDVRNVTYTNVIKVQAIMSVDFGGDWMPAVEYFYYFSKGVGLIKQDVGEMGAIELVDYQIK